MATRPKANFHIASTGPDSMTGTEGNDTLIAQLGDDTLLGLGGDDLLWGQGDNDSIYGGAGADRIDGGDDDDWLDGGDDNDQLQGAHGNDTVLGGDGNDAMQDYTGDDVLDGGAGIDTLSYSQLDGAKLTISLLLTGPQNTTGAGMDTIINIENVAGSFGDDVLIGNDVANGLSGGPGWDKLYGNGGDDTLDGGGNIDTLDGGDGSDTATFFTSDWTVVDLRLTGQQSGGATLVSIENVVADGNTIHLTGNASDNRLESGAWSDVLRGIGGNDTLVGNAAPDTLEGGSGDDLLLGGTGYDTALYVSATSGVVVRLAIDTAQDTGGAGNDVLSSLENLTGSAFRDYLLGTSWANRINGGGGHDWIYGGRSADTLTGGTGRDTFVYAAVSDSTLAAPDTVRDFSSAQGDKFDLTRIDADAVTVGDQAFVFIGGAAFGADATGQLRYAGGLLYGSIDADSDAEFSLALTGAPALVAADFVL